MVPWVRSVAQPGSALDWGSRGRRFKSGRSDHGRRRKGAAPGPWVLLLLALLLTVPVGARADALPIEAFFGHYLGKAITSNEDQLTTRDLGVTIGPISGGFNVTWETVTHDGERGVKRKRYSIDFQPSGRPNIFRSGMRTDMFGQRVPLDPMSGDPFVWARLVGSTLTVYALLIREDGGFEIQTYARTRTPTGLDLVFTRISDAGTLRTVRGTLTRVD